MAAIRKLELSHGHGAEPAQVADREIDLPEQEHEDDAEGEHAGARHLDDDVVEVVGGEEDRRLDGEEEDDQHEAEDDREDSEVARPQVVECPSPDSSLNLGFLLRRKSDARCRDVGLGAHVASSGTVSAMPATLVGIPAVMACTTSCCVVVARS